MERRDALVGAPGLEIPIGSDTSNARHWIPLRRYASSINEIAFSLKGWIFVKPEIGSTRRAFDKLPPSALYR
jgi:hypothetical protein